MKVYCWEFSSQREQQEPWEKLGRLTLIPRFIIIALKPTPGVRQKARL